MATVPAPAIDWVSPTVMPQGVTVGFAASTMTLTPAPSSAPHTFGAPDLVNLTPPAPGGGGENFSGSVS